jgi:DNA-binding PadR family transcriptional regulator
MDLTPTARVILALIREGRTTGYEIKQLVDVSTRFFWPASYGQIYPELRRLEEAGLIEGEDQPTGGRHRRSYRLTPAGEDALFDWLGSGEDPTYEVRDEGLLKTFFSTDLPVEERVAILRAVRRRHEAILAQLSENEKAHETMPQGMYMVLRAGKAVHEVYVRWCDDMERELLGGESGADKAD